MRVGAGTRDAWHGVQFYEDDAQLCACVGDYLGEGLRAQDTLVVVSTPEHSLGFRQQLSRAGHNVDAAVACGQLILWDARDTLSRILRDSKPNEHLFRGMVEPLLLRSSANHSRVRLYGEMVDLLWGDGNRSGAIQLEQLWNEVHDPDSFWLLCAYRRAVGTASSLQDLCSLHTHVIEMPRALPNAN